MDPDYVPCGTSFGLSFGPWLEDDGGRTCVLGYLDRNYVGFRKLRIDKPWTRGQLPKLQVENKDTHGQCVHLTTDGFIEFEQGVSRCRDGLRRCLSVLTPYRSFTRVI